MSRLAEMTYIVYPLKKYCTDEQIFTWFADGVANGDIDPEYLDAQDVATQAKALDDAGIISLGRPL